MQQTDQYKKHLELLQNKRNYRGRRRKKKDASGKILVLILVFLIGGTVWRTCKDGLDLGKQIIPSVVTSENQAKNTSENWNLILVNRDHPIPDNYQVQLTELSNGKEVDSRIYPELQQMFNDARAAGLSLFVREGYRTKEDQQQILDERIQEYENQGDSREEAQKAAEEYVALPGTSEHELGLSVDINADTQKCSSDAVYQWLNENAWKYGFIKRYPSDKTDITGISNEPWHYRYVGKEAAKAMKEQNLCLEEYLGE